MTALPNDAVLLIIDVQKGMDVYAERFNRNNPALEQNIARLQPALRKSGRPIIHVQHFSRERERAWPRAGATDPPLSFFVAGAAIAAATGATGRRDQG